MFPLLDVFFGASSVIAEVPYREVDGLIKVISHFVPIVFPFCRGN